MRSKKILLAIPLLLAALLNSARAEEPAGYSLDLFDGETTAGWVAHGSEIAAENGALVLHAGDGFIRAPHAYRDFVLELEWRPRKEAEYDSGVYFRAQLPPEGKPWPKDYQINLRAGQEGQLLGVPGGKVNGRLYKPGEWNHLKLTVVGPRGEMEINGKPAWSVEGLEERAGYIGLQSEVPLGGQFEFRNLKITELGFRSLLGDDPLTHWEPASGKFEDCWEAADGVVTCTGQAGPWLRSRESHADFNLRLEYRVTNGANSGVYVRVPKDGNHHGKDSGIEVQVLDNAKHAGKLKPFQYSASLYAVAPAEPDTALPAGEWNSLEIDCRGPRWRVVHNGVRVVDAEPEAFPALAERLTEGYFGLQNHRSRVSFRRIRLGPAQ